MGRLVPLLVTLIAGATLAAQPTAVAQRVSRIERGLVPPVIVNIPVIGAYSPTWPLHCKKSDKIVRDLAARYGL